jgi:hypothetical protein
MFRGQMNVFEGRWHSLVVQVQECMGAQVGRLRAVMVQMAALRGARISYCAAGQRCTTIAMVWV